MKTRIALVLALMLLAFVVPTADAQCAPGALSQADMAGTYLATASNGQYMFLEIHPCGGIYLRWTNEYGTHEAVYVTVIHPSDGIAGIIDARSPEALDGQMKIGIKAAEPGYVQVVTTPPSGARVYRLAKMS